MRRILLMLALAALAALAIGTANVLADDGQGDNHDGDHAAQCTTQPTTSPGDDQQGDSKVLRRDESGTSGYDN